MRIASVLAVLVVLAAAQAAQADILVGYDLFGVNSNAFTNPSATTVAPGVAASTLTRSSNDTFPAGFGGPTGKVYSFMGGASGIWLAFTVTPTGGPVTITSVDALLIGDRQYKPNFGAYLEQYIGTTWTQISATTGQLNVNALSPYQNSDANPDAYTFTPYSQIVSSSPVQLRIHFKNGAYLPAPVGPGPWAPGFLGVGSSSVTDPGNAIQVNGTPEPATMGLLAIGGIAAIVRRRRA